MTDCEILMLVDRLERCSLAPTEFHHCHHLAVATAYLYAAGLEPAVNRMRATLQRFVAYHGGNLYHETATRFWMIQVENHLDRGLCLHVSAERVISVLADKGLIYEYYSKDLFASARAKEAWIEPDLKTLVRRQP